MSLPLRTLRLEGRRPWAVTRGSGMTMSNPGQCRVDLCRKRSYPRSSAFICGSIFSVFSEVSVTEHRFFAARGERLWVVLEVDAVELEEGWAVEQLDLGILLLDTFIGLHVPGGSLEDVAEPVELSLIHI